MARGNFENLVLNIRLDRKQKALQDALLVPWSELEATADEYVQWHCFILWVRAVSESAGEIPDALGSELRRQCPGFLKSDDPAPNRPVWQSLEEWIAAQYFGEPTAAGWFDAVMYYAYKDLRTEQAWTLWERTKAAWRQNPPSRWPTFEEWTADLVATSTLAQEGTEKARAVEAMTNVDRHKLQAAVCDVLERRAFAFWVDCVYQPEQPLDPTVMSEIAQRCPDLMGVLSAEPLWCASVFCRLIRRGDSEWRAVARAERWYAALRYHVAHHPRYQRLIHYRQRCHAEWLRVRPISFPPFLAWLSSADAYCVSRAA